MLTFEEVQYAYLLLLTRTIGELGMIPLVDFANANQELKKKSMPSEGKIASANALRTWLNEEMDSFCLVAAQDIKEGAEVTDDYQVDLS